MWHAVWNMLTSGTHHALRYRSDVLPFPVTDYSGDCVLAGLPASAGLPTGLPPGASAGRLPPATAAAATGILPSAGGLPPARSPAADEPLLSHAARATPHGAPAMAQSFS